MVETIIIETRRACDVVGPFVEPDAKFFRDRTKARRKSNGHDESMMATAFPFAVLMTIALIPLTKEIT
jgi:hypothetical protein